MMDAEEEPRTILCPNCGKEVPNTTFCISCGVKFDKNMLKITTKGESTQGTKLCPLCRKEIPDSHNFCHYCGGKIKKEVENHQFQSTICSRCWKSNPPNIDYCIHCGIRQQQKRIKLLETPFEGFQLDISQFFEQKPVSASDLRQGFISSKNFPVKSVIMHSSYFGVTRQKAGKLNVFTRNLGGFNFPNLINYFGVIVLVSLFYIFWYSNRYFRLVDNVEIYTDIILIIGACILLTGLMLLPTWLATFFTYRNTGYRLDFRLESSRVFVAVIFNIIWMYLGFFGPIFLRMGEFKQINDRLISQKGFSRGLIIGVVFSIIITGLIALLSLFTLGLPGEFVGFLFQNHPLKSHIITSYIGATWISLLLLMPFGDYYDKVIKNWNQIIYFILFGITLLYLTYSFRVLYVLSQVIQ